MKQSQFSLSSIAIASLAFLLNWLVFVDSAPLAALTAPFEVDGASQRGNLLPTFPPDTAALDTPVLDFETSSYAVKLIERNGIPYISVRDQAEGRVLVNEGVAEVIEQGGGVSGYRYQSAAANQPTLHLRLVGEAGVELSIEQGGQQQLETGQAVLD